LKTGVLLFNLGGPWTLKDVKPFLKELFSDEDILVDMPSWLRKGLAYFISEVKGRRSIQQYARIGGGSPQLKWTQGQAKGLETKLKTLSSDVVCVEIGMRASEPTILNALKALQDRGVERLIVLPLFPHYSSTTTGSCYKELYRQMKAIQFSPLLTTVRNWPADRGYIELLIETLEEQLGKLDPLRAAHVLISAHSLPLKIVERGDVYPQDVDKTTQALCPRLQELTKRFPFSWSLAFQSRNGPVPWLKPYTEDEIVRLGRAGTSQIIVLPISFVSDHIETLSELDIDYKELAHKYKVTTFLRTRSFNDDPKFIQILFELVRGHVTQQPQKESRPSL